jgi:hypothetical protein
MHSEKTSSSTSSSSSNESTSESDNEKIRKTTARRNYLRAQASDNMRNAGIYNGAALNHYHQQQILHQQQYQQQQQQQHLYRQSLMQGYDNYAYSQCSYAPSYYGQYSTHSNFSYPQQQQYVATPTKMPTEFVPVRYAMPIVDSSNGRCARRDVPSKSYSYYDYQNTENTAPIQTIANGYNYTPFPAATNQQQTVYRKNSTATSLNFDYHSQNSMILNDVPTYEMTNNQQQQQQQQQLQASEKLKRAASENSLRFINIAAVGGSANLGGSSQSINKNYEKEYDEKQNMDLDPSNDLKRKINFLNFDKNEKKSACKTNKIAVLIGLAVTITVIVVLAAVLGSVLPQSKLKNLF